MFKKTVRYLLVGSLALSLLVAGCGGKDATSQDGKSGEKVTVTFWDINAGPDRTPYYEELIKKFEAANPTIHVEYVGLPKNNAKQKIDAAVSANDMPDVAALQTSWIAEYTARNALLPMDEYFDKWSDKDKISAALLKANRELALDHKLYQIPTAMNMECMWYRADWFKEAGLTAPETWDQFFAAVAKLTDKAQNRYGYSIRGGNGGSFQLERMMFAYTGQTEYIDKNGKCTINSPENVEFVKKYLGIYQEYTPKSDVTNGYKEMVAGFDTGAVAYIQHNLGSFSEHSKALKPDQFAPAPLPKSKDGKYLQVGGNSWGFAIFKSTKHADAAWKFVSFLASASSQSYFDQKTGEMPTHADSLAEDWAKQNPQMQMAAQLLKSPDLKFYEPPIYLPDYRAILDQQIDPGIQAVMTGKKSVEDFLNEWAAAIEKSKQKYDAAHKK